MSTSVTDLATSDGDSTGEMQPAAGPHLRCIARSLRPYALPLPEFPIDLRLDSNEGPANCIDLQAIVATLPPDVLRRYSTTASLEQLLAARLGVDPAQVIVTAGGDDAIDRACRSVLEPGRELILPMPSFEMIARSARLAGADVRSPLWKTGPFPLDAVLNLVTERTSMIAVVTPNNPTGAVATRDDLSRLSAKAPNALLLVDLAYTEFADDDLTSFALTLPNAVVIRTLSKAYSLAGLRVGYAVGGPGALELIEAMRTVGLPYPVSSLSIAVAASRIEQQREFLPALLRQVRDERAQLAGELTSLGIHPQPSQGNFILAEFPSLAKATWTWTGFASLGISVRRFTAEALSSSLRISCPGDAGEMARLLRSLRTVLAPEALLLDMDGVIADVSMSYRRAIVLTAESFGITITPGDISAAKARGGMNNDWHLTHSLLTERGIATSLAEVTERFERLYHGTEGTPGLESAEELIPPAATLERLKCRLPLGIVTGRPRRDCTCFLERFGISHLFSAVICMEDAPLKPDPAPVTLALELLGVSAAWLVGDTPDDLRAARAAGVLPLGVAAPGDEPARAADTLRKAGAAAMLTSLADLENLLP